MSKLKKICFTTIFIAVFLILLPIVVKAKSYSIEQMDIDATIQPNGDLKVEQSITYDFDGSYNGIYLTIPYEIYDVEKNEVIKKEKINDDIYTGTGVEIKTVSDDKNATYTLTNKAKNGYRKLYTIEDDNNIVTLRIYSPSTNEKKTFNINYTIENLCVLHNDVGELYYNFIGGEWDCDINNLNINVSIPDNTNTINIWGHGPIEGTSTIKSKRLAEFTVPAVRRGQYVAVRVIFDREAIGNSKKVSNIDARDIILQNEADIFSNKDIRDKFTTGVIIISIILLIYWIILLMIFEREKKYPIGDFDENKLFDKYNPIIAVILNLIEKQNINLKIKSDLDNGEYLYYISRVPEKEKEMDEVETYVYDWIFTFSRGEVNLQECLEGLGQDEDARIKFKELNNIVKKKINKLGANKSKVPLFIRMINIGILIASVLVIIAHIATNKFEVYINNISILHVIIFILCLPVIIFVIYLVISIIAKIKHKVNRLVQKITGQKVVIKTLTVLSIFLLIIILTAIFSPVKYIITDEILLCIAVIIVVTDNLMLKNNEEIEADYNRLNAIKDKIEYYSLLNEKDIEHIKLWNKYLCYAVSFGISKKIIERISGLYLDDEISKLTQDDFFENILNRDYDIFYMYSNSLYRYFRRRSRHGLFDRFMARTQYVNINRNSNSSERTTTGFIGGGRIGFSSSSFGKSAGGKGGSFSGGGSYRGGGGRKGGGGAF